MDTKQNAPPGLWGRVSVTVTEHVSLEVSELQVSRLSNQSHLLFQSILQLRTSTRQVWTPKVLFTLRENY